VSEVKRVAFERVHGDEEREGGIGEGMCGANREETGMRDAVFKDVAAMHQESRLVEIDVDIVGVIFTCQTRSELPTPSASK
jgi:hypothetical protein